VGNHNHVPVLLVDTGGTLSHHACVDSERTFGHGIGKVRIGISLYFCSSNQSPIPPPRGCTIGTGSGGDGERFIRSISAEKFVQYYNGVEKFLMKLNSFIW